MNRLSIPFFLGGMGSSLEVYPVSYLYPIQRYFPLADTQLLASDWFRVGHAIYSVLETVGAEARGGEEQEARTGR